MVYIAIDYAEFFLEVLLAAHSGRVHTLNQAVGNRNHALCKRTGCRCSIDSFVHGREFHHRQRKRDTRRVQDWFQLLNSKLRAWLFSFVPGCGLQGSWNYPIRKYETIIAPKNGG